MLTAASKPAIDGLEFAKASSLVRKMESIRPGAAGAPGTGGSPGMGSSFLTEEERTRKAKSDKPPGPYVYVCMHFGGLEWS